MCPKPTELPKNLTNSTVTANFFGDGHDPSVNPLPAISLRVTHKLASKACTSAMSTASGSKVTPLTVHEVLMCLPLWA
jgi:hypothetical protein